MHDPTDTELAIATPMAARPNFLPPGQERRRDPFPRIVLTEDEENEVLLVHAAMTAAREIARQAGFNRGMKWGLGFGFFAGSVAMAVALVAGYCS